MTDAITTSRLTLRPPRPEDAPAIAAGIGNFNVTRFLTKVPFPYAVEDAQGWIAGLDTAPETHRAFVITRYELGPIGVVGLESELGYWLAEPYWGRGYATEAAAAALAWYFGATDAVSIGSGAHEDNPASLHVQDKLGFIVSGERSDFSVSRNKPVRVVTTTLTRAAFEAKGYLS